MQDSQEYVLKVLSDITALPEQGMRMKLLCSTLLSLSSEDAAHLLEFLCKGGHSAASAKTAKSLLIDVAAIRDMLGKEACAQISRASVRAGLKRVARLFSESRPHRTGIAGYDKEEELKMEHLSLGQRRSLSKTGIKDSLDRLLSDPDPMVIGNILSNPRITEKEILKIASKRPNAPEILRLISSHKVWSKRYSVMKAIASNPYAPTEISIALLGLMMRQDLKNFARDSTLHPEIRQAAKELLEDGEKGF
ncbi:MAG: hypothetical protein AABZ23_03290 [Deltaproteobacteria bacterium]